MIIRLIVIRRKILNINGFSLCPLTKMDKILEYKTIKCFNLGLLDYEVKCLLLKDEGWQPYGPPYLLGGAIHQPMVKYQLLEFVSRS